jgi:hypothetical protein
LKKKRSVQITDKILQKDVAVGFELGLKSQVSRRKSIAVNVSNINALLKKHLQEKLVKKKGDNNIDAPPPIKPDIFSGYSIKKIDAPKHCVPAGNGDSSLSVVLTSEEHSSSELTSQNSDSDYNSSNKNDDDNSSSKKVFENLQSIEKT